MEGQELLGEGQEASAEDQELLGEEVLDVCASQAAVDLTSPS